MNKNTQKPIQSSGGIIYYMDKDNKPKFLLLKRFALSKKIEWVAPKGKIDEGESPEEACIREIQEEVGIKRENLLLIEKVGDLSLSLHNEDRGSLEKEIAYFLVKFNGNPNSINVSDSEGFVGMYKWADINDVLGLIYYENLRELFRKAYGMLKQD